QVVFKKGDLVLLDTKNLPLKTVNKNTELKKAKLAAKKVGPFVIERMVNDNVAKLILPSSMKRLNPTFNIELLTHYQTNRTDVPNRPIPKAVPLIVDDETGEDYIVEKLLKKRTRRRKREWLIKCGNRGGDGRGNDSGDGLGSSGNGSDSGSGNDKGEAFGSTGNGYDSGDAFGSTDRAGWCDNAIWSFMQW
ncbi:hypothetical protein PHMEG_00035539, partial [Phytophthora megakarya]